MTGLSRRTLQGWRLRGKGPTFYRLGTDVIRYEANEVEVWIRSNAFTPEVA